MVSAAAGVNAGPFLPADTCSMAAWPSASIHVRAAARASMTGLASFKASTGWACAGPACSSKDPPSKRVANACHKAARPRTAAHRIHFSACF
jgi:hypothetical protein